MMEYFGKFLVEIEIAYIDASGQRFCSEILQIRGKSKLAEVDAILECSHLDCMDAVVEIDVFEVLTTEKGVFADTEGGSWEVNGV